MFDQGTFAPISSHSSLSPKAYTYYTEDTIQTVLGVGYFDDKKFQLEPGDWIFCNLPSGHHILKVGASTDSVDVSEFNFEKQVIVRKAEDFANTRSDVEYFIDGVVDMGTTSIQVPAGGLYLRGHNFDVSKLISSADNYTMFTSAGAGNVLGFDYGIEVTGSNSKVYNLTGLTGFEAFEFQRINYNNCTSLGEIINYRQGLETGTGRFGGTPELTLTGTWVGGYRITTSIVRGLSNITALFKAGPGFLYNGRFITDINCNLPTTGALLDFSDSNITNDESLIIQGAFITRQGVIDASDAGITPNITEASVKSSWGQNTGIKNTQKYIKGECTAEVLTPIALSNTYYPLLGTITIATAVHFSQPANGEYELLTGNGQYQITGDITIAGVANNQIDIKVAKSTDGGATFPTDVQHIQRQINNLSGLRDVAFFPINFVAELKKGDRIRLEVENKTSGADVTQELGSFLIITQV